MVKLNEIIVTDSMLFNNNLNISFNVIRIENFCSITHTHTITQSHNYIIIWHIYLNL